MARDRQRAKQRRRRAAGSGGSAGPASARTRARDAASAPAEREPTVEPTGAPEPTVEPTGAPEPTENAFPLADEARMAEAGVPVEPARDEEPAVEPAPDELEPGGAYAPDPAVAEERAEVARPRRKRGKVLTFLGHVVDELRRVQWPDRRQTAQGTAVTLGFVVIAGGFLGLMDAIWKPVIEAIL
jgi:preprotein translocase SecE subunit